jgi:hypothetical protein
MMAAIANRTPSVGLKRLTHGEMSYVADAVGALLANDMHRMTRSHGYTEGGATVGLSVVRCR